jgi:hypothetical protein
MNGDPDQTHPDTPAAIANEPWEGTQDPGFFSPVFGDIAAKMKLAIDVEVRRLLALGLPVWVDRGNGVERLYSLPEIPYGAVSEKTKSDTSPEATPSADPSHAAV